MKAALAKDPSLLTRLNIATFEDFIPIAQRYLNLVVEGQSTDYSIRFGDVYRPWLVRPRDNVPSYRQQIEEIAQREQPMRSRPVPFPPPVPKPRPVPDDLFPLVTTLLLASHKAKGVTSSKIKIALESAGRISIDKDGPSYPGKPSLDDIFKAAMKWCNVERICTGGDRGNRYRLTNRTEPFKLKVLNDSYFRSRSFRVASSESPVHRDVEDGSSSGVKRKAEGEDDVVQREAKSKWQNRAEHRLLARELADASQA